MGLIQHIRRGLAGLALDGEKIIVAVSGGVDSLILVTALAELQTEIGFTLHVATFDHGLRGQAGREDAAYVKDFAAHLGLGVTSGSADGRLMSQKTNSNVEAMARELRYTFLAETAVAQDSRFIALGHHREDQVETVLMHILRGSGLAGLRGMLPETPLSSNHILEDAGDELFDAIEDLTLIRPLLDAPRQEILAYAEAHGIQARHDATNDNTAMLRNRLRHEIIPVLETLNPNFRGALCRLAQIAQGDYEIIERRTDEAISRLVDWGDSEDGEFAFVEREEFLRESKGMQRHILRRLVMDLGGEIDYDQAQTARTMIDAWKNGTRLNLPGGLTLSIGYDEFTVHTEGALPYPIHMPQLRPGQVIPLSTEQNTYEVGDLRFHAYWVLEGRSQDIYRTDPLEATLDIDPGAELSLRTRRNGDRFSPFGMGGHSQKLGDIFTNLKVPRGLRDRVPLLTVNEEIVWFVAPTVSGIQGRVADSAAVTPESETMLRVRWEHAT